MKDLKNSKSETKGDWKYVLIAFFIVMVPVFLIGFIYQNYYMGNYFIQEQWINSSYQGQEYCDNCLWIRFSEGCNRYPVYFFANQHELDTRFNYGDVVNINFRNVNGKDYVSSVDKAYKYRYKCS